MMKIALFLAVGLVVVFNSPVNAELTEEDGQKILDAIKDEVAKNLLKAYLCDNVNSAAGINQVLVDIAKRVAENQKN
ncbi:venom protein G precursor [Nasonia vitripennis]|uniref:Uncharacterized protein n=1 Tax=Nasonia vitripennis TaxID=7425 RepID=A0A7M6UFM9_NASVI|nr:venom protein G precursor [Nasonia vitripennis]